MGRTRFRLSGAKYESECLKLYHSIYLQHCWEWCYRLDGYKCVNLPGVEIKIWIGEDDCWWMITSPNDVWYEYNWLWSWRQTAILSSCSLFCRQVQLISCSRSCLDPDKPALIIIPSWSNGYESCLIWNMEGMQLSSGAHRRWGFSASRNWAV